MNEFIFSLEKNTSLKQVSDNFFLISEVPLKILRLNRALFLVLKQLQQGSKVSEIAHGYPPVQISHLLHNLLSLTSKGYLKLGTITHQEIYPRVSIVIPVKDRPEDISECLQSLAGLNYPKDKLETIVVDDGSRKSISDIISPFNVKLMRLEESRGASICRNVGAEKARGDFLAFLDADCTPDKNWLNDIIPFMQIEGIGAVGGVVDNYYRKTHLDRYEEKFSSLNLGRRIIFEGNNQSNFYVPSCNLVVNGNAFKAVGGFKSDMHVGEDVDFCWRMRKNGYALLYVPVGKVAHKHRNKLIKMLQRRRDYGTSEAILHLSHRDKKKRVPVYIYALLVLLALIASILLKTPYIACLILLFFGLDLYRKHTAQKPLKIAFPYRQLIPSILRGYFSFYYFVSFHLIRYYLILMLGLGFLFNFLWIFCGVILLFTSITDYCIKKPSLPYPVFLFFYILEHLAYQAGVFWGCLKLKYFGSYIPAFNCI